MYVAAKFLPAPPSSVESERIFSKLSGLYTVKRTLLSGENAKKQLFLLHHFDD
jgi:hypothetical protein